MSDSPIGFVWIVPSDEDFASRRLTAGYHLGCAYLSAYLQLRGYPSKQYLLESLKVEDFASQVVSDGVRIIGFSAKDTNYYAVRWAAKEIKKRDPSIFVTVGGLTATFSDDLLLTDCSDIDACIRGYGEINFHSLVVSVLSDNDWRSVPGISYRNEAGQIVRNPDKPSEMGANLDYYPSPYLSGVLPGRVGPKVGLSTSRGCIFRCTFCNPTAMAGFRIAYHSDDRVVEELAFIDSELKDSGFQNTEFMLLNEDVFALDLRRTKRLCDRIASNPPRHLRLGCETRIEHLDEETLRSIYSAGFGFLKFGLESGNPRVLNNIKKVRSADGAKDGYAAEKAYLEKIRHVVGTAKSIGFRIAAGAIFGLPGESLADAIDTLHVLRTLDVDEYYHNFLQLFPGTEIFGAAKNWGYTLEYQKDFYPTIYRTQWPYQVRLVPRLEDKLKRVFRRNVVEL